MQVDFTVRTLVVLALGATCLVVAGCASSAAPLSSYSPVKAESVIGVPTSSATSLDDGGQVVIVRSSTFLGMAAGIEVRIDRVPVARIGTGERYDVFLQDGLHVFGFVPTLNLGEPIVLERPVEVRRGKACVFRIGFALDGLHADLDTTPR